MRSARVRNAEKISCFSEIEIDFFHYGIGRFLEIDMDEISDGASHLVHQSAWLPEISVLGELTGLRYGYGIDLHVIKKTGHDGSDERLECRGRRKARSDKHVACYIGIESAKGESFVL